MSPEPTGDVKRTPNGRDLTLSRELPLPEKELWAWITESDRLERWFGSWTGRGRPGEEIAVTMTAEEGNPTSTGEIVACDPGHSYGIKFVDEYGNWHLDLEVGASEVGSKLTFVHHLDDEADAGQVGAGWEYYLDRLVAAVAGDEMPDFNEYWPAMGPYYAKRG